MQSFQLFSFCFDVPTNKKIIEERRAGDLGLGLETRTCDMIWTRQL